MKDESGELDLTSQIEQLELENSKLKKRAQEAEGELTIIKGIGNTSPEMRALQARVKELDNSLSIALETNDKFQRQNVAMRKRAEEVEEDNKRLSQQISDYIRKHEDSFRKAGL
jgi:chromosome segregation ATPase